MKEVNSNGEMDGTFLEGLKKNPFIVQENYFDHLHEQILSNVKLAGFKEENPFKVSEDYFLQTEKQILAQANLPKESTNAFEVPENYFDNLQTRILSGIEESKSKNNVRSIFNPSFIRYAAAILVILSITLGLYFNQKKVNVNSEIANIPDQEIIDYLNTYSDPSDIQFILENTNDLSSLEDQLSHL
ncbi:hypothetical protein [Pseudopedobacter sp.]|uniref:hypothetical protein n=1 Tax=Pseudopedobacter sp. TaxID=1936787 RepID=UPI00333EA4AF